MKQCGKVTQHFLAIPGLLDIIVHPWISSSVMKGFGVSESVVDINTLGKLFSQSCAGNLQ